MTKPPQHKKHIRMIEFEPANDFQEEMNLEMLNGLLLNVFKPQIEMRHQKNKFTIKYLAKDDAEKPHKSI